MSRGRPHETLHAVQLFPFVAVLLCTMGSLLVILVGVARSSKVRATQEAVVQQAAAREAAAARAAESAESAAANQLELEKIGKYQAELDSVRAKAEERLRNDQLRMSHLEDHMRRLREKLESLKLAAAEMNGLEGEQIDNRKQAESEIERLEQLIAESRTNIDQLRADAGRRARSFAIVPYQGKSGTFRRPIYIECRDGEVVLQPEGVVFTIEDFQPPIGPGNPLVAAIRAAREYIHRMNPSSADGKAAEPYPLIIVRPKGVRFYYYTREAIQSWDSEFGYELVEEDWELKFGSADPQLANIEFDAAELSRGRLRALAAAAPQAYGAYRGGGGGGGGGGYASGYVGPDYGDEDDEGGGYAATGGGRGAGGTGGGAGGGGTRAGGASWSGGGRAVVVGPRMGSAAGGSGHAGAGGAGDEIGLTDDRYAAKGSAGTGSKSGGAAGSGTTGSGASGTGTSGSGTGTAQSGGHPMAGTGGGGSGGTSNTNPGPRPPGAQPATEGDLDGEKPMPTGRYAGAYNPQDELDDMARASAADPDAQRPQRGKARGKNWALRNANPGMIPIRRTIQLVVRDDAIALVPDAAGKAPNQEFRFGDLPGAAYEDLAAAVDKRIDDWGMAGQGLYWRPVVELQVSSGGERRVDDLMRLLEHSGVEVRDPSVAANENGGAGSANR